MFLYKSYETWRGKPTLGYTGFGFGFFLRLICSENSKSSLINASGLMDFNQNLDTAVNYVPHKRLSMCFIYFPRHTLSACSLTCWNRNKSLFLRIQLSIDQLIYQVNTETHTPRPSVEKTTALTLETRPENQWHPPIWKVMRPGYLHFYLKDAFMCVYACVYHHPVVSLSLITEPSIM